MLAKFLGFVLVCTGLCIGVTVLIALVGTALGILWFCIKLAIPVALIYLGYRVFCAGRRQFV